MKSYLKLDLLGSGHLIGDGCDYMTVDRGGGYLIVDRGCGYSIVDIVVVVTR